MQTLNLPIEPHILEAHPSLLSVIMFSNKNKDNIYCILICNTNLWYSCKHWRLLWSYFTNFKVKPVFDESMNW